jgi:hypothetical protein
MSMKLLILIMALSAGADMSNLQTPTPALLPDGLILRDIDGKLTGPDTNDEWFFEPDSDITDNQTIIKAGIKLRLLPSATLEKIIADANERSVKRYRLNVRVTKYKGRNFLFPFYFLPISESVRQQPQRPEQTIPETTTATKSGRDPNLNDANDILSIPPEVLEKVEAARAKIAQSGRRVSSSDEISADKQKSATEKLNPPVYDSALIDRAALLVEQKNGGFTFVLDAFGRNAPQVRFRLLPCEALELAELKQSAELEPMRFKIAGITTKYKGSNYLLLQKATRIYSQGNFRI